MDRITLGEALPILYKGQSNVQQMATRLGMPLVELQQAFRDYVAVTPLDATIWQGDIELGWPWA